MRNFKQAILLLIMLWSNTLLAQHIEVLQQGNPTSIRGLSVVNNQVAWISGSKGNIAITTDGGKSWKWQQIKGFEKSDFRDIEAFSAKEAIIMSSGTPALIMKTIDGGINWKVNYQNADTSYFLDAMDFDSPKHGFVMGDPINGKFLLMETKNGGDTWTLCTGPDAVKNQAAFAASGTCLRINGIFAIATGGPVAALLTQKDKQWTKISVPITHGKSTQGAFSIAVGKNQLIIVGGDYQKNKRRDSTACYSFDKGKTWQLSTTFPSGYQSGAEYVKKIFFYQQALPEAILLLTAAKTGLRLKILAITFAAKQSMEIWFYWLATKVK
ncbi:WD40/YVTN/BNR-like repeat-containing protein [Mucilaginibacter antarcticus]|uniref:WD40/YVTN/BNR-like repeat-containing protein n=1 Tax=Mucilaginibacter antarcticus TaxID=1855725 RepID=UPI0036429A9D